MSKGIRSVSRTLFGGSDSNSQQSAQQSSSLDPRVFALMQENYERAKTTSGNLGARQFAGFSPLQRQGFNFLSGINQNPGMQAAQGALAGMARMQFGSQPISPEMVNGAGYASADAGLANLGSAATAQGMGYSPTAAGLGGLGSATGFDVSQAGAGSIGDASTFKAAMANAGTLGANANINRGDIRNVAAKNFLQGNVGAYMNPYTSQVIDSSMRDIDRARQLQQQQVNAQAAARGAYGGSRQAVAEAENNRNFLDQQARTISGLRQQGFDTAANLMQADMNRALQADMSNQSVDLNTAAANQQAANQFALTRYGTEADISRFNAANRQQADAANAAAQNQFALTRYGTEADLSRFNAANQNAANQFLAGAMNDFGLQRFGAENALNQFNAANANAASQFGAGAANAASLANQQAANQFALSDFNAANNMSQFNAANANNAAQFGADAANRASLANQSAGLTAQTQNANNQLQAQQLMASNLGNLFSGGIGLNNSFLGNINAQLQAGALQQQLAQQRMDAIRNLPLEQLQITSGALGLNPFGGAGNVSQGTSQGTSRAGSDPGLLGGLVGLFK